MFLLLVLILAMVFAGSWMVMGTMGWAIGFVVVVLLGGMAVGRSTDLD